MSAFTDQQDSAGSRYTGLKITVLALFAVVTAIVAVSFSANHMRSGFEKEYVSQMNQKTSQLAETCSLMISGDEIASDMAKAQSKYASILPAILVDSGEEMQSRKVYALYSYANGSLTPMLQSSGDSLAAQDIPVSEWLTAEAAPYSIYNEDGTTVLTPIKDGQGKVVALFELSSSYKFLGQYGNTVEHRVLMSVLVSGAFGIALFSLQYLIPVLIRFVRKRGEQY